MYSWNISPALVSLRMKSYYVLWTGKKSLHLHPQHLHRNTSGKELVWGLVMFPQPDQANMTMSVCVCHLVVQCHSVI